MIIIRTEVLGAAEVVARLNGARAKAQEAIDTSLQAYSEEMASTIRDDKLSGQVLHVRTGDLRNSITALFSQEGSKTFGGAAGGAGIPYAKIHEYGGVITAKNAPYLKFRTADGQWHAVKQVVMPERSYMRSTFSETVEDAISELKAAVLEAVAA